MKRIFYVFPLLFLLAACSPEEVEFTIKDKFITDVVINAEGFPTTEDATDRGYRNLIDPSYKVFIEFSRGGFYVFNPKSYLTGGITKIATGQYQYVLDVPTHVLPGVYTIKWTATVGSEDVVDLSKYPKINPTYISIVSDIDNEGSSIEVMQINSVPSGNHSGIGHNTSQVDINQLIPISTKCDYEITFLVKLEDLDNLFTVGVNTYDTNGNLLSPIGTSRVFSLRSTS